MDVLKILVMCVLMYQVRNLGKAKDKLLKAKPRNMKQEFLIKAKIALIDEELELRNKDIMFFRKVKIGPWFGKELASLKKMRKRKTGP